MLPSKKVVTGSARDGFAPSVELQPVRIEDDLGYRATRLFAGADAVPLCPASSQRRIGAFSGTENHPYVTIGRSTFGFRALTRSRPCARERKYARPSERESMSLLRILLEAIFIFSIAAPARAQRYTAKQEGDVVELADTNAQMNVSVIWSMSNAWRIQV